MQGDNSPRDEPKGNTTRMNTTEEPAWRLYRLPCLKVDDVLEEFPDFFQTRIEEAIDDYCSNVSLEMTVCKAVPPAVIVSAIENALDVIDDDMSISADTEALTAVAAARISKLRAITEPVLERLERLPPEVMILINCDADGWATQPPGVPNHAPSRTA